MSGEVSYPLEVAQQRSRETAELRARLERAEAEVARWREITPILEALFAVALRLEERPRIGAVREVRSAATRADAAANYARTPPSPPVSR